MPTLNDINNATGEFMVDKKQIDAMFKTVANTGQGNCLFFSFSQIFTGGKSQQKHAELRKQVCDFYKDFDVYAQYAADSVEEKIQMMMLSDEDHANTVCVNYDWGTLADIYVIALIHKVNVVVFSQYSDNPSQYAVVPIKTDSNAETVYLKYNTLNPDEAHYEAMRPKSASTTALVLDPVPIEPVITAKKTKQTPIDHNSLIGATVSKKFKLDDGGYEYYIGTISAFNAPYYVVEYEDGENEELTKAQINRILLKGGKRSRKHCRKNTRSIKTRKTTRK
jgi:hypothetical protein